ncbi:hypothetical protein ACQY0O_006475 [Thecaphora frezii]
MFATPSRRTRSSSRLSTGRADSAQPQEHNTTPQRQRAANRYARSPSQSLRMSPPGVNSRTILEARRPSRVKEEDANYQQEAADATSSTSYNHSRAHLQPSSFFVRERSTNGHSSQHNSFMSAGNSLAASASQLLRGAQKPSFDPYSPSHSRTSVGMHSILSSEPEDSRSLAYDYQAEERIAAELEARELQQQQQHQASDAAGPSQRNGHHLQGVDGSDLDNLTSEGEEGEDVSKTAGRTRRRRPRASKDNLPYRPDSQEEDLDSDVSVGGKKHSHRRRSRNDWPKMREGRDDNKIWCNQKKKRRSPRKKDNDGNDLPDDSFADDTPPATSFDASITDGITAKQEAVARTQTSRNGDGAAVTSSLQNLASSVASLLFSAPLMVARLGWQHLKSFGPARLLTCFVAPLVALTLLRAALSTNQWGTSTSVALEDGPRSSASNLFGLFGPSSRSPSLAITPPNEPPTTFVDLADRLTNLEGAFQIDHEQNQQRFRDHEKRISKLEDKSAVAAQQIRQLEAQFDGSNARLKKLTAALDERQAGIQDQLRQLQSRFGQLDRDRSQESKEHQAERSRLQKQVAKVEAELQQTRSLTDDIRKAQRKGDEAVAEFSELVAPLRKLLPAQMPVRTDPKTGRIHIEPAFWKELKKVFATIDGDAKFLSAPEPSWTKFIETNEAALSKFVSGQIDQRFTKVLDRDTFVDLLGAEVERAKVDLAEQLGAQNLRPDRDELVALLAPELDARFERAKAELSDRFNDNVEALQNEILAKVRQQNQMYEESGSWRPKGAKLPGSASAPGSHMSGRISFGPGVESILASDFDIKLKDGTDLKGSVLALIDAALEHYSADRIGMRDYALYSAGGRIVPEHTSETYSYMPKASWTRWLPLVGSGSRFSAAPQKAIRGRPPLAALHPDTSPGMCWSFAGATGSLGIHLSRPIQVKAVSLEHTPRILSLDEGASAPREVVVWGLVADRADREKLASHRASQQARAYAAAKQQGKGQGGEEEGQDGMGGGIDATPAPPSDSHFLLTTATYELQPNKKSIQTFQVPREVVELGIYTDTVQFQFLSNHGHAAFTCVYRVRVHGDEQGAAAGAGGSGGGTD